MSKHGKEKTQAPLADWEVSLGNAEGTASAWHHIPSSRWKRTAPGWYTFSDEQGIVAEFPPGVVLSVIRKVPPVIVHPPGWASGTGDEAEVLHAEHHPGTIVPSLDSCPEHDRADYEARVERLNAKAAK